MNGHRFLCRTSCNYNLLTIRLPLAVTLLRIQSYTQLGGQGDDGGSQPNRVFIQISSRDLDTHFSLFCMTFRSRSIMFLLLLILNHSKRTKGSWNKTPQNFVLVLVNILRSVEASTLYSWMLQSLFRPTVGNSIKVLVGFSRCFCWYSIVDSCGSLGQFLVCIRMRSAAVC